MKICIIGTGNQGTGLAGLLAQEPDCEEIILIDYAPGKAESAKQLIETLGDRCLCKNIKACVGDATDIDGIVELAQGSDFIFNGMNAKFNYPVMRACLKVGAHYMDLRSNVAEGPGVPYNETIAAQLDMDEEFKEAGITAFPCNGLTPGWSNLAALYMIKGMDKIDSVILRCYDWLDSTVPIANITPKNQFLLWMGPPFPSRMINGELTKIPLLESEEEYPFPEPIGTKKIYTFTQDPDIALISNNSPLEIPYIESKMGFYTGGMECKDVWLSSIAEATANNVGAEDMFDLFSQSLLYNPNFKELCDQGILSDGMIVSAVEVTGVKNEVPVRHTCYCAATMKRAQEYIPWGNENVIATIGGTVVELALMLCRGEFTRRGVIDIGELTDLKAELDRRLINRGLMMNEKIERGNFFL